MTNSNETKTADGFFFAKGIAILIILSWIFQIGYQHQLEYNLNQDFLSHNDREDLGFFWFLILVARLFDFGFSIGLTNEILIKKSRGIQWLSFAIVIIASAISFPWLVSDHPQELGWLSLKASFFLRFAVAGATILFLLNKERIDAFLESKTNY